MKPPIAKRSRNEIQKPKVEPGPRAPAGFPKSVQLRDGESIWNLAVREYGTNVGARMIDQILRANGITNARTLRAGKPIKLPVPDARTLASTRGRKKPRTRTVRPAASSGGPEFAPDPMRYDVRPALAGDSGSGRTYVVRNGDSLGGIAVRFMGSVRHVPRIMALNGLQDADKIRAGMKLKIPTR